MSIKEQNIWKLYLYHHNLYEMIIDEMALEPLKQFNKGTKIFRGEINRYQILIPLLPLDLATL